MNQIRLDIAIQAVKAIPSVRFYQPLPQSFENKRVNVVANTYTELVELSYHASFTGHLALDTAARALGCCVGPRGELQYQGRVGIEALYTFLDCDWNTARCLNAGDLYHKGEVIWSNYYSKPYKDVTVQDVLNKLERIMEKL